MRTSNFTLEEQNHILNEKAMHGTTVRDICKKYGISVPTYYLWKRKLSMPQNISFDQMDRNSPSQENEIKVLRRLYINLSAHNYELAKFLEK